MVYIPPHFIAEWREARKASIFSSTGWWLNRWPALGWAETLLKVIAWTYAPYVALVPPAPGAPSVFLTAPAEAAGAAATTTAAAGGADAGTAAVGAAAAAAAAGATTAAAATLPASPRAVVAALAGAPGFAGDAAFALQTGVMAAAAALILAAIIDRLVYREVISAIFVVPNSWAHVVVVASMVLYLLVFSFAVAYGVVLLLEYRVIDAAAAATTSRRLVSLGAGRSWLGRGPSP